MTTGEHSLGPFRTAQGAGGEVVEEGLGQGRAGAVWFADS